MATQAEWQKAYDDAVASGDWAYANKIATSFSDQNDGRTLTTQQRTVGAPPEAPPEASLLERGADYAGNLARQFSQGTTFGFGDEIVAGLRTGLGNLLMEGSPYDYQQELARERREMDQFEQDNQGVAMAADLAGGFMSPANLIAPGGAAATAMGRLAQAGGRGALEAGIEGFGRSEGDLVDRLMGGGESSIYGGFLGAGSNPVMAGLGALGRQAASAAAPAFRSARENAETMVGRLLQRTGAQTPEAVEEALTGLGPDARLMDLNRQTQALTGASRLESDEAGKIIDAVIDPRQKASRGRVAGYLSEAAGEAPSSARYSELELGDRLQRYNQENYPAIDRAPITAEGEVQRIMDTPYVQDLMRTARRDFQSEYKTTRDPFQPNEMTGTTPLMVHNRLKILMDDRIKELDETIIEAGRAAKGKDKAELSTLVKLRSDYVRNLDQQVSPGEDISKYQIVRQGHEEIARKIDALDQGRKLARTREGRLDDLYERVHGIQDRQTQTMYDALTEGGTLPGRLSVDAMRPDEMVPFRRGAVEGMTRQATQGGPYSNVGNTLTRDADAQKRLDLLADSPQAAERLREQLGNEMQMFETIRMAGPSVGSRTQMLAGATDRAEEAAKDLSGILGSAAAQDTVGVLRNVFHRLREPWNPEIATEVSRLLTRGDLSPADIQRMMQRPDIPEETKRQLASLAQTAYRTGARQGSAAMAAL